MLCKFSILWSIFLLSLTIKISLSHLISPLCFLLLLLLQLFSLFIFPPAVLGTVFGWNEDWHGAQLLMEWDDVRAVRNAKEQSTQLHWGESFPAPRVSDPTCLCRLPLPVLLLEAETDGPPYCFLCFNLSCNLSGAGKHCPILSSPISNFGAGC